MLSTNCKRKTGHSHKEYQREERTGQARKPPASASLTLYLVLAVLAGHCRLAAHAATYHIDPAAGNDSANGSASSPWRTLDKAKATVAPGDTVNLMPGHYGSATFSSRDRCGADGNFITFQSDPNSTPYAARFSRIAFSGKIPFYITLRGFEVEHSGSADARIEVENGSWVRIIDCKAHGRAGGSGPSYANIFTRAAKHILIQDCEIYYSGPSAHGVQLESCDNVTVRGCHVHDVTSSGIRTGGGQNYIIEYNVIHDQRTDWNPSVHGSGISIHSHNTVIRGNIVYNYGNTRPIRFYQGWAEPDGYRNMLVENNLVYKMPDFPGTQWWTEFIDIGPNCVFRNNTFVGDVTMILAPRADGSGLSIHNNIVTGRLQVEQPEKWPNIRHGNNIMGKLAAKGCGWMCFHRDFSPSGNNRVGITCSVGAFFRSGPAHYPYTGEHPYQLDPRSPAVGFADEKEAPPNDLLGHPRAGRPDAGCLQLPTPRAAEQ